MVLEAKFSQLFLHRNKLVQSLWLFWKHNEWQKCFETSWAVASRYLEQQWEEIFGEHRSVSYRGEREEVGRSVGCSELMVTVFRAVRLGTKLITVDCLILIKTFHQQFIRNAVRAAAKSWAEVQCQLTSECGEISEIRTLNIYNIYAESSCQHIIWLLRISAEHKIVC